MGLNATFEIGWENYVTLNTGFPAGDELILQRKMFQVSAGDSYGGLTLGAFIPLNPYRQGSGQAFW